MQTAVPEVLATRQALLYFKFKLQPLTLRLPSPGRGAQIIMPVTRTRMTTQAAGPPEAQGEAASTRRPLVGPGLRLANVLLLVASSLGGLACSASALPTFPNIEYAGVGYNVVLGNPAAESTDPGASRYSSSMIHLHGCAQPSSSSSSPWSPRRHPGPTTLTSTQVPGSGGHG